MAPSMSKFFVAKLQPKHVATFGIAGAIVYYVGFTKASGVILRNSRYV